MKIMLSALLGLLTISATAQDTQTKSEKWEKYKKYKPVMTRHAGISLQKFENLNARLATFPQYAPLKNHMWTLSAGSMHNVKNFISELSVTVGSSLTGNPDKRSSTMRTLSGGMDFGYDVIPSKAVMLYPTVGIGGETFHAVLYKDVNAVSFNDVANSPIVQNSIRSVKFVNNFATYRLGLGLAFNSPKGYGSIGLKGTYIGGFKTENWESAEYQTLSNAPSDNLRRVQISLVFTGGHGMMKK